MLQTILGAGGPIANNIALALPAFTDHVRLVSRNPKHVTGKETLFPADLLDAAQVHAAVEGSEIVYLVAGLPYNIKTWRSDWPVVMKNVIDACKAHHAKLVFFDNVYMYGLVKGEMTENTPINPVSEKGKVRAHIAQMLLDEVANGSLTALIARAADFYGPQTPYSFLNTMVFENLAKGKSAQLMVSDSHKHAFTYTPDAGRATALLGNTPSAYNQVWHVSTDPNALTGKEMVAQAASAFGVPAKHTVLAKWMVWMAGLFIGVVKESYEMLYQSEHPYLFSSAKFDAAFPDFKRTSYAEGIAATAASYTGS